MWFNKVFIGLEGVDDVAFEEFPVFDGEVGFLFENDAGGFGGEVAVLEVGQFLCIVYGCELSIDEGDGVVGEFEG